jgi:simple sugar transport system permease protein
MKTQEKGIMVHSSVATGKRLRRFFAHTEFYMILVIIALIAVVTTISPRFLSGENLFSIALSSSYTGIFSIGFLFVLITGGLDISFLAVATVAQYLTAMVMVAHPQAPIWFVIALPLVLGVAMGAINTLLIHYLNAPSMIITIATQSIFYGLLQFATHGEWLYNFPDWFVHFPRILVLSFVNERGVKYGLSIIVVIWLAVALVASIILRHIKVGRRLYALGGNLEASHRAGIGILRYRFFAYCACGFTAGLGGLVHSFITQTVAPNTLVGNEFTVVAAVVLGGASIFGGTGSIGGSILGVAVIALITNALTIMKVPNYWHAVCIGGVVLLSMSITALSGRLAARGEKKINVE